METQKERIETENASIKVRTNPINLREALERTVWSCLKFVGQNQGLNQIILAFTR